MNLRILQDAEEESLEAMLYYEDRREGLGFGNAESGTGEPFSEVVPDERFGRTTGEV